MIRKCDKSDIQSAVDYIGEDKLLCFYLYMDVLECGIDEDDLNLWLSTEDGDIKAVLYQYYDCLHIFSRQPLIIEDIMSVINEIDPKVIVSNEANIDTIKAQLDENKYTYELNHIITTDVLMQEKEGFDISPAEEDDVPAIAELMMKDHIYSSVYSYEKLCNDLRKRLRDGFGRLFVIKDDEGHILCANATYAETDDLAVIGGLVTAPEMRGRGLGGAITASTWNLVKREGKRGLAFLLSGNDNTISLHKKMGYEFLGYSARMIRN